jgi:hypothetical protein
MLAPQLKETTQKYLSLHRGWFASLRACTGLLSLPLLVSAVFVFLEGIGRDEATLLAIGIVLFSLFGASIMTCVIQGVYGHCRKRELEEELTDTRERAILGQPLVNVEQ